MWDKDYIEGIPGCISFGKTYSIIKNLNSHSLRIVLVLAT